MARQTLVVFTCDNCGTEIEEGKEAKVIATPADLRKQPKHADFCSDCFGKLPGEARKRKGRKPNAA